MRFVKNGIVVMSKRMLQKSNKSDPHCGDRIFVMVRTFFKSGEYALRVQHFFDHKKLDVS